jgi:drug/metabolite transporter (DMT)-like permease
MRLTSRFAVPAALVATGMLLGTTTVLAKLASGSGVPPIAFLAWSGLGAAVLLGAVNAIRRAAPPAGSRVVEYFFVAGLLSFALPNALLFSAIPHVGAGFAALSLAFPPALTYMGAVVLRIDQVDPWRGIAVALSLGGAAVLAAAKGLEDDVATVWLGATLAVPFVLAAGNLYRTLRWPQGASPTALAPGVLAASASLLLAVGAMGLIPIRLPDIDRNGLLLLGFQALVFSAQYALFFYVQRRGGPVYLSLIGSVAAVFAVPASIIVLDEPAPRMVLPAALLVCAGLSLMVWRSYRTSLPSR